MPWIRDRVDAYDFMKCPHCGAEATIGDFCWGEQGNCCPVCGKTVTCEEWLAAIERAALIRMPDDWETPKEMVISDDEARRILGEGYGIRKGESNS
jgi:hypothetical protein